MKDVRISIRALIVAVAIMLLVPAAALAAGTAVTTPITNNATLSYTVGGGSTITDTATVTFNVDRKVVFTVTNNSSANVNPGVVNNVLAFQVDNTGNGAQGFAISLVADATDDFDMSNVRLYNDNNSDGLLDGGDTLYTVGTDFVDIAADGTDFFLIVADTPGTATNTQTSVYHLVAEAVTATTHLALAETAGAGGALTEELVFADATGSTADGADFNNKYSATGTYTVVSAIVTFSKTSVVVWDPANYNDGNQKPIPGAYVEYTVTIANDALSPASAVLTTIADVLQSADTTLIPYYDDFSTPSTPAQSAAATGNDITLICADAVADRACSGTLQYYTAAADADGATYAAPNMALTMGTMVPAAGTHLAGELDPGDTITIKYMVSIN